MFYGIFSPILIVFCICPELHELGDIVEEGEDHNDTDVAPPLTHTTLVLIVIRILPWVLSCRFSATACCAPSSDSVSTAGGSSALSSFIGIGAGTG